METELGQAVKLRTRNRSVIKPGCKSKWKGGTVSDWLTTRFRFMYGMTITIIPYHYLNDRAKLQVEIGYATHRNCNFNFGNEDLKDWNGGAESTAPGWLPLLPWSSSLAANVKIRQDSRDSLMFSHVFSLSTLW